MSRPTKIPKPEEVWRKLEHLQEVLIPSIVKEYEQAYGYVHDRADKDRADTNMQGERGERVQTSTVSDPTAELALQQGYRRKRVARLGTKAMKTADSFGALLNDLQGVFKSEDDDYQPLASYRPMDSKIKTSGEAQQRKRQKLEELHRYESRAAQLRNELFGRSA